MLNIHLKDLTNTYDPNDTAIVSEKDRDRINQLAEYIHSCAALPIMTTAPDDVGVCIYYEYALQVLGYERAPVCDHNALEDWEHRMLQELLADFLYEGYGAVFDENNEKLKTDDFPFLINLDELDALIKNFPDPVLGLGFQREEIAAMSHQGRFEKECAEISRDDLAHIVKYEFAFDDSTVLRKVMRVLSEHHKNPDLALLIALGIESDQDKI